MKGKMKKILQRALLATRTEKELVVLSEVVDMAEGMIGPEGSTLADVSDRVRQDGWNDACREIIMGLVRRGAINSKYLS